MLTSVTVTDEGFNYECIKGMLENSIINKKYLEKMIEHLHP
jgi:succinate dehydrogenase flavin-adding protein (antitoxin of CptAB toxin-antitoxin module)